MIKYIDKRKNELEMGEILKFEAMKQQASN
jgi:hypothetical protein